jgi:lysophospholipase L1-like esterase
MSTKTFVGCVIAAIIIIPLFLYFKEQRERDQLLGKQSAWADYVNDSVNKTFVGFDAGKTVFVGTEITAGWGQGIEPDMFNLDNETYPENRGIPLNTITHIRGRIPKICRYRPKAIVLEGGINDIINGKDKSIIFQEIWDITDSILIISPKTQIFLTSILPVSSKGDSARYNPIIRDVNNMVQSFVLKVRHDAATYPDRAGNVLNLHYVDYANGITDFMYEDDIHLNSQGYLTLKHILKPFLDEAQRRDNAKGYPRWWQK